MDHLRHQKYKNKQLKNSTLEFENNFKPIIISINDKCTYIHTSRKKWRNQRQVTKNFEKKLL